MLVILLKEVNMYCPALCSVNVLVSGMDLWHVAWGLGSSCVKCIVFKALPVCSFPTLQSLELGFIFVD
jgi:hypothetical protein